MCVCVCAYLVIFCSFEAHLLLTESGSSQLGAIGPVAPREKEKKTLEWQSVALVAD